MLSSAGASAESSPEKKTKTPVTQMQGRKEDLTVTDEGTIATQAAASVDREQCLTKDTPGNNEAKAATSSAAPPRLSFGPPLPKHRKNMPSLSSSPLKATSSAPETLPTSPPVAPTTSPFRQTPKAKTTSAPSRDLNAALEMSALSEDSYFSYPDGEAKKNYIRPVAKERGGWFEEKEVLVGVRFIIGDDKLKGER